MGLCIHYSGRIKDASSLPALIEDIKDICKVYNWEYIVSNTSFPGDTLDTQEYLNPIYGIWFTPPESETISLTFLSNGIMVSPHYIEYFGKSEKQKHYIYTISVKTQYTGYITHAIIINLFKYLENKYLTDFKMTDESRYWETGDEDVLKKRFKEYDALMDNFMLAHETFPIKENEGILTYLNRLVERINKMKNR